MIVTTTDSIPGKEIHEILGVVEGNAVKTRGMGKDFRAAGRSMAGGDMPYYAELMEQSRQQAMAELLKQAAELRADAVVCVRYQSAAIMRGAAEVLAYGTAVRLR
ncbi:MAG: YbjQ family protein [Thermoplasmata archaeon]|nr:YbjQ family protein [Thermoplasmata archaeon]